MTKPILRLCCVALWTVVLLACEQEAGEPCQVDRDCASGLECNITNTREERGRCVPEGTAADGELEPDAGADASTVDAGRGRDAAAGDASRRDAAEGDAGFADAAPDAGDADAGDAALTDGAADDDGGA